MQASGYLEMIRPRTGAFIDTSEIDRIVPYFDIAIGLCLLLGLLRQSLRWLRRVFSVQCF